VSRRRGLRAVQVLLLLLAGASALALGQEGILVFSVDPASAEVTPEGTATIAVRIENESIREADDIELTWVGAEGISLSSEPTSVSVLAAFASATIRLTVTVAASAPLGELRGDLLEAIYTYCIDDLCYEIVEPVKLTLRVVSPADPATDEPRGDTAEPGRETPGRSSWLSMGLGFLVVLLAFSWSVWRAPRLRLALYASLAVAGGLALGFGVSLGQHRQAQAVGAVLCTSCVGIETAETARAELSAAQAAAVDRIAAPVDLLVFHATWCRSCPYAEALVDLVASRNPLVRYRLVDAEVERDLAVLHGVTRAGRTVVPAIACLQTGKILFGAEDLGDRLVALLQEAS
jgi:hypothetical protein